MEEEVNIGLFGYSLGIGACGAVNWILGLLYQSKPMIGLSTGFLFMSLGFIIILDVLSGEVGL